MTLGSMSELSTEGVLSHRCSLDDHFLGGCAIAGATLYALVCDGIKGGQALLGDLTEVGVNRWQRGILIVEEEL